MERFKADKFQDFRSILLDFVNLQIAYNERVRVYDLTRCRRRHVVIGSRLRGIQSRDA